MRKLFDPFFTGYCLLWVIIHVCRRLHYPVPLLNGHLTDFTAIPAIAHLAVTITRIYIVKDNHYSYPLRYLIFMAAYISVVFEWVIPRFSSRYTGDVWDVAAYFAGSLFYFFVHARSGKQPAGVTR
ncbi:hypothetical protein [Chitinophaga solisilvae]|uniref:hypothetical protein n=1 Tax=Chitinophaga solisilvae TaxID=1233460 RepID=UPI00136A83DA|nr:hypothetical protein [Chitinophaga solisilvae]